LLLTKGILHGRGREFQRLRGARLNAHIRALEHAA
jgi:hypothetical protein